jgi:glycopeptide antibiotics resistance protein
MKRKPDITNFSFKDLTWLVFGLYAVILVKMILFKRPVNYYIVHFRFNYGWDMIQANFRRANLVPFTTILLFIKSRLAMRDIVGNVLGNILGFIPFGILVPMLFEQFARFIKVIKAAFVISLVFECIQLIAVLGSFDVDDLLLNTVGASIGYYIYYIDHRNKSLPFRQ